MLLRPHVAHMPPKNLKISSVLEDTFPLSGNAKRFKARNEKPIFVINVAFTPVL
jgi:hypothetical protein